MATSWAWKVHLFFVRTSPAGGASSKEMNSTNLLPAATAPALPATAAPAPAAGDNGARPADEPPKPPAGEGGKADAGDPAPCEGAVLRAATSKPGRRRG